MLILERSLHCQAETFCAKECIFFTEHVSAIIQQKISLKYNDLGSPIIPCIIGYSKIDQALVDLRAGVNLLHESGFGITSLILGALNCSAA
jgi:hypothetical protein